MPDKDRKLEARLGAASVGAFLLWLGFCLVTELSWGVGLLGVATIILGTQAIRASAKLGVEGLWVVVGLLFASSGLWHVADVEVEFGPIVLMVVGAAIVLGALFGRRRHHEH